jgi:2'-5' RNA ligase
MNDPIFFIAILPPKEIQEKVTSLKAYASRKFNSSHALKSPPHVTLQAPFRWSLKKLKTLRSTLEMFSETQSPFSVELKNWDHFSDRVIFIDVAPNVELMDFQFSLVQYLHKKLSLNKDKRPYHPHMTVAFKDLKPYYFQKAWAHFSNIEFDTQFEVKELTLLRHNGAQWEIFENYPL